MLNKSVLDFLKLLKNNNNKPWMDANRDKYLQAKVFFEEFGANLIVELQKMDNKLDGITIKDCTFRINRDVRFSKNKEPYKNNFGLSIKQGGRKSIFSGYYVHLEPGASFLAAGFYAPDADILKKIRQEIDYNLAKFEKVIKNKKLVESFTNGLLQDDALKNAPKGYEKDNKAANYLKLKHFVLTTPISNEDLLAKDAIKKIAGTLKNARPFVEIINESIDD